MAETGVIILAHGSRGERGKGEIEEVLQRLSFGLRRLLAPGTEIIGAALQFNHPSLEEAVAVLSGKGVKQIIVVPYFLFSGRHITEHIPQLIESFEQTYPGTQFLLANSLGLDKPFISLVARRIKEAAPELMPHTDTNSVSPVEQESMKIVAGLLPSSLAMSEDELTIIKRIVHSCGDSQVAPLIKFSPSAVSSGLNAIARGSHIFTDVHMVMAGINEPLTEFFGCPLACALDGTEVAEVVDQEHATRTAAAICRLGAKLNGAIVAIGNAPTALLALLEMVDHEDIKPALIVGMPVGFVKAKESKEELMKRDIPYITITGTRGGSPMAAAAVNSLLRIAVEKRLCNSENEEGTRSDGAKSSPA